MASPQRFSEMTDPGDEPIMVDEDFEIVDDDSDVEVTPAQLRAETSSGGIVGWILFSLLITACTATVLLVALPMYDELQALRVEGQKLAAELKTAHTHEEDLAGENANLDAARVRLTASLAQKAVELEDELRARADLERRLKDEIKKNAEHEANAARGRKTRRH